MVKCRIEGCNSVRNASTTLFKVPMDKEPREKWISQIEKHQPFNYYLADFWVCEHHFDPSSVYCKSFRKFLFKGAFPTNFTGQKAKEPGKKKRKSVKTKSINDANKLGITEKIEPIENNDVAECNITIKTEQPDVVGADLDNLFETIDPDSLDPLDDKSANIVIGPHRCQKSMELETELKRIKSQMEKLQQECNKKTAEIERLNKMVKYYKNQ